jgi:hypothetical protein
MDKITVHIDVELGIGLFAGLSIGELDGFSTLFKFVGQNQSWWGKNQCWWCAHPTNCIGNSTPA